MATPSYKDARRILQSLSREEREQLMRELSLSSRSEAQQGESASILELCGLGQEIWNGIDAQQYVARERSSWNG